MRTESFGYYKIDVTCDLNDKLLINKYTWFYLKYTCIFFFSIVPLPLLFSHLYLLKLLSLNKLFKQRSNRCSFSYYFSVAIVGVDVVCVVGTAAIVVPPIPFVAAIDE